MMNPLQRYSDSITMTAFAVLTLAACGYFFFAATQGEYGLYEKGRIEAREVSLTQTLLAARTARMEAENKITRLSDGYLDLDLLDEQARAVLGYARPDEIIIR